MKRWICLAAFFTGLLPAAPVRAGTGAVVEGKVNLGVQFTYREADVPSWKPLFEEASRLLYNATNGQLQLGRIRVSNSGSGREGADVWILGDHSGAFANVLGLGGPGHIYLSQTHRSTAGLARGQFGLVHEFGHYGFGIYDEYKGVTVPPLFSRNGEQVFRSMPNQFCSTEDDTAACIMDGGTTIVPNHSRTEFCSAHPGGLSTGHNEGIEVDGMRYVNAQQDLNGESCWETIGRAAGLAQPLVVDLSDPPGLQPIDWRIMPDYDRVVIALDRSASMGRRSDKFALARSAADLLVGLLHQRRTVADGGGEVTLPGEHLAVVSFADDPRVDLAMREMLSDASRDSARAIVDAIGAAVWADHPATDLGGGLAAALDQISASGENPAPGESVILLTDGRWTTGNDPRSLVPALRARGVHVYPVGIGWDADAAPLAELADSTGGLFFLARSGKDLPGIAQEIMAAARSAGVLQAVTDTTNGQSEPHAILIDSFAEEVTFALQWSGGTLDLTLTSPTGDQIDVASADDRPDVDADIVDGFLYIRVSHPELGTWQALVQPVQIPGTVEYSLRVSDENANVSLQVTTGLGNASYPQPIVVRAEVVAGVPVAGAQVRATVQRPTGDPVPIVLHDDGSPAHGDEWAGDGVYQAIFSEFSSAGAYAFLVRATNTNGTGPDPDLPFVEDGPGPPASVPPFVRETTVVVDVPDVSGPIPGSLELDPPALDSGTNQGWVLCRVELSAPNQAGGIEVESLRLNGVAPDRARPAELGDGDHDGIPDLTIAVSRAALIRATPDGAEAAATLCGRLRDGRRLEASGRVSMISAGKEAEVTVEPRILLAGQPATIRWSAGGATSSRGRGYLSLDGGTSWQRIFLSLPGRSEYVWTVASAPSEAALFLVEIDTPEGVMHQSLSGRVVIEARPGDVGTPAPTRFLGADGNPMIGGGELRYSLSAEAEVNLAIYDISGRLIRNLVSGRERPGPHSVRWDGTDGAGRRVPSGAYLYTFRVGKDRSSGRLTLVR